MKRKIAFLLSLIMIAALMLPINAFAAESDFGLENAITAVKTIFTIPADYTEFNSNVNMDGSRKIWYLNWNPKDASQGSINVSIDDHGTILNYNNYKPIDYNQRRFPKLSRPEAVQKANEFLQMVNPSIAGTVKLQDDSQNQYYMNADYYINYIRLYNGIPVPENSVSITVNGETGEVMNYNLNWTDDLVFPSADKAITLEAAQQAYKDKLGLKLVYNQSMDSDNNAHAYAVYVPVHDTNYYIDALTGDKLLLNPFWYGYGGGGGPGMAFSDKAKAAAVPAPVTLTPQELKAIEEVSKLMQQDAAESKARAVTELGLTADYKLTSAGLTRDWPIKSSFTWNLNFTKDNGDPNKEVTNVNVSVDAVTGEVKSFYRGYPYNQSDEIKFTEEQSKEAVEQFLQQFAPDKFSQSIFEEESPNNIYPKLMGKVPQRQYNFTYTRKVNGIPFTANTINVGYDAVYGKIVNYNVSWYDLDFPAIDKALPLDSIYTKMFSDIGLEMQYRLQYPESNPQVMPIRKPDTKPEVKLVYAVKSGKPVSFDANTGAILDYNGLPYKEVKPVEYTDISGNFAEKQIMALAGYGIALEGKEFKPAESITQQDFFRLLSRSLNFYPPQDSSKELDEMYKFLIQQKVVKPEEKAPDSLLTREDAVKFIIRAMKYDKVADIKSIFRIDFKDADQIDPALTGYIAIAQGLNIVKGYGDGTFNPQGKVARAEAAVMLYNYMQQ